MQNITRFALVAASAAFISLGAAGAGYADDCSGHDHSGATAAGAVGGGLIGGLATHSVAGGIGGAVVGGLIGNSVARSDDCSRAERHAEANDAYQQGYEDRASQDSGARADAYDHGYQNGADQQAAHEGQ